MFLFNKAKISSHDESDEWFWQGPCMVNPKTQFSVEEMIRAKSPQVSQIQGGMNAKLRLKACRTQCA